MNLLCCQICTFYCPSGEDVHPSSWGNRCTHLAAHASVIHKKTRVQDKLLRHCFSYCRIDSYWWIGPISSIASSNDYTKRINNTTQTRNSTVLCSLLWYLSTLYHSNIFGISINVSEQSFPNEVLKISGYIFWVRLQWLKIIKNYCKSPLKVCELKVWVKYPPDVFQNVKTVHQRKPNLNFIRVIKNSSFKQSFVWFRLIWFLTFADDIL